MARPRAADHQRTLSEPEQREFFPVQPEQRQQRACLEHNSDAPTEAFNGPVRRFKILKSTPLGLVCPQNVYFSIVDAEAGIAQTGYAFDLPTASPVEEPVFVTNQLKWWKQKLMLPPSFKICPGGIDEHAPPENSRERGDLHTSANTGLHSPAQHGDQYPLAEIKYHGWQGITSMSIALTIYNISPSMHYQRSYSHNLPEDIRHPEMPDIRSQYTISRLGYKREYILRRGTDTETWKWRSPSVPEKTATVHSLPSDALSSSSLPGHGNLILEDHDAEIVAVYKQWRDYDVMGSLTVSTARLHGSRMGVAMRDVPDERITLEAVAASCLAVVVYERVGWQNLLGR